MSNIPEEVDAVGGDVADFLVIGAMKAGTTTLFHDLRSHPAVYMPEDKEPSAFCSDAILSPHGRREYASLFHGAEPSQVKGEASTTYSMLPEFEGVADRAHAVLGASTRIIYVVRDPVQRILSQYRHDYAAGLVTTPLRQALRSDPRLLSYSSYAMQLRPWAEAFGAERIHVVHFESYVAQRDETVRAVLDFLGVPTDGWHLPHPDRVFRRWEEQTVVTPSWERLQNSWVYRKGLRRLVPPERRSQLRAALLPRAPKPAAEEADLEPESIAHIMDHLSEDLDELHRFLGIRGPLWPPRPVA